MREGVDEDEEERQERGEEKRGEVDWVGGRASEGKGEDGLK